MDKIDLIDLIKSEPASNDYKAGFRACANMIDSLTIKPWYNTSSPTYGPWKGGFDFAVEHIKDVARRGADLVEGVPNERRNKFPEDR